MTDQKIMNKFVDYEQQILKLQSQRDKLLEALREYHKLICPCDGNDDDNDCEYCKLIKEACDA